MTSECQDYREDIEAYALRALPPDEETRMRLHLEGCAECRSIAESYRLAVEEMALALPTYRAPARLKSRVMGGAGVRQAWSFAGMLQRNRWIAGTAAAAVLAFAIGASAWAMSLSAEVGELREQNRAFTELSALDSEQRAALLRLESALNSARSEQQKLVTTIEEQATLLVVALDPELIPSELRGTTLAPGASCDYVWSTKQSIGALTCRDLPGVSFGVSYELWANKGEQIVPVGTFVPRDDGTAQLLVKFPQDLQGPVTDLFVTLERLSSPPQATPTGSVILVQQTDQQAAR